MPWRFNPFTGNLDETDIPAFNGEVTLGSAASPSIFFTGDPNTGIYSPGADQVAISTNGTGRLFVDASGNVGVNAASTGAISTGIPVFEIKGNSAAQTDRAGGIRLTRYDGLVGAEFYNADGATYIDSKSPYPLIFYTNGSERMVLDNSGRLGLGTSSPGAPLTVRGGSASSPTIRIEGGATGTDNARIESKYNLILACNGDGDQAGREIQFRNEDTNLVIIDSSGNVGVGTTGPDSRLHIQQSGTSASGYTSASNAAIKADFGTATNGVINLVGGADLGIYRSNSSGAYDVGIGFGDNSNRILRFDTAGTERLRITSDGKLGLGTSSPVSVLTSQGGSTNAESSVAIHALGANQYGARIRIGNTTANTKWDLIAGLDNALNTGFQIKETVSGLSALYVNSSGNVGVGTTSPSYALHVEGSTSSVSGRIKNTSANGVSFWGAQEASGAGCNFGVAHSGFTAIPLYAAKGFVAAQATTAGLVLNTEGADPILFGISSTERARIDSSGRLLVGTSSTSANVRALFQATSANSAGGGNIYLARGESTPADGADLGSILFSDSGHSGSAIISAIRDGGTWTSGTSQPTRLVFSTTADGASSPTPRVQINSSGALQLLAGCPGIDFSGIQTNAAGMTSETLDSYEEGTWTVSVADANTGGNVSATTATAYYTKIGRFVECIFNISNIDTTGLTAGNDIYIRGFPFEWGAIAVRGQGSVSASNITFTGYLTFEATGGFATCRLTENASNSGVDFVMVSELSSGSARISGRISGIV